MPGENNKHEISMNIAAAKAVLKSVLAVQIGQQAQALLLAKILQSNSLAVKRVGQRTSDLPRLAEQL